MIRRLLGPAVAVIGILLPLWGWFALDRLGGTPFWEFRYLGLGIAAVLLLSLLEAVLHRIDEKP